MRQQPPVLRVGLLFNDGSMNRTRYQTKVAKKAKEYFKKKSRGKLIWACGSGKSRASVRIAQELGAKKILICAPSIQLVSQLLQDFRNGFKDAAFLCVCSDDSVAAKKDEPRKKASELGIAVSTDQSDVSEFLKKRGVKVVVTTYQSGEALCEGAKGFEFDFGVFDEAHRTAGSGVLSRMMLLDENVKIKKRLFMTATERRYKGKSDEILCMSDESMYGGDIDVVSFAKAVEYGWLCDYKIVALTVTEKEIADHIISRGGVHVSDAKMSAVANEVAAAIVMKKAMDRKKLKKAITFHASVSAAKRFKDLVESSGESAFHVNGCMPSAERKSILGMFEAGKRTIVTNAQCLTEGVDIPSVDCIVFADPKKSVIDVVQAAGRAMRTSPGKDFGYIVVPVVVSSDDREEIEDKSFQSLINIIRGLGSVDERIIAQIRKCGGGGGGPGPGPNPIEIDFEISLGDLSEKIRERVIRRTRGLVPFWSFEKAREWARNSGIRCLRDWLDASLPLGMPRKPDAVYKHLGWICWADFLGSQRMFRRNQILLPFNEARDYARNLGLNNSIQWRKIKHPPNIPARPENFYKESGWSGWGDFIGFYNTATRYAEWATFSEATEYARSTGVVKSSDWRHHNHPKNIPNCPDQVYANCGWNGWGDFLGRKVRSRGRCCAHLLSLDEAKSLVHRLNIRSSVEWRNATGKPENVPARPELFYRNKGWKGWPDFLGTGS